MKICSFDPIQLVGELIQDWGAQEGPIGMGIPGGRSPGKVLEPLAAALSDDLRERFHLFWVDERAVPPGHADRNDLATLEAWQRGGGLPKGVFPMPAQLEDLEAAAQSYADTLAGLGFENGLSHSLLGIGEDGHFASLFPEHIKLSSEEVVFAIEDSPKPPPQRLSLGLPYLLKSQRIDVLVFGADKGQVLKRGIEQPGPGVPVSLLLDHPNLNLHLDAAAQAEIS